MVATDITLDLALLVAAWTEALLYGIFVVLFITCLYILGPVHRQTHGTLNLPLLGTAIALFVLTTIHLGISFSRIIDAFITYVDLGGPGGAIRYFANLAGWKEVVRTGIYVQLTITADSLFIYRCWIVWSRNWLVIAFPILLLIGSTVSGYGTTVILSQLGGGSPVFTSQIAGWITSFFTISLAQNLTVTVLIVSRIWRSSTSVARHGGQSLWPVISIILESGAIYSTTLFVLLMLYVSGSNAQYIVLDMVDPIIGIVFSLIIVRVGLQLNKPQGLAGGQSPAPHFSKVTPPRSVQHYAMDKLNVTVSRRVDVEGGVSDDDTGDFPYSKSSQERL